ncbi:MAG: hypothetical protein GY856_43925, partial [bacterium]|nr:hypothetical protein [bacterium]
MVSRMLFATSGLLMAGLLLVLSPASTRLSHAFEGPGAGEHARHGSRPDESEPMVTEASFEVLAEAEVDASTRTRFRGEARAGVESRRAQELACAATVGERADECGWASEFFIGGLDGTASSFAVYDDGSGEALYVGGSYRTAGGVITSGIAKWDGTAWSAVSGPAGTGANANVSALAVYDDGSGEALYVGGDFTTIDGVTAYRIAKWDGTTWSALSGPSGNGTSGDIKALAVYDDGSGEALYAGGKFVTAGGVTVNRIAKWDGTGWSALSGPAGTGMSSHVSSLAVYDGGSGEALYAGGLFTTAGGVTVNHIAKWDGTGWSALSGPAGTGTNMTLRALGVYDDGSGEALYAGGSFNSVYWFTSAGGVPVHNIAKWNGIAWSAVSSPGGGGMSNEIRSLAVYDDGSGAALYAGGDFNVAGSVTANNIAKWDGTEWSALSGPAGTGTDSFIYAFAVYDDGSGAALYAGGGFTTAGGVTVNN